MKNKIKLALNVIIGAIITAIIYGIFVFLASSAHREAEALLGLAFLIVMPAALFFGSWVTGFLSIQLVNSKKELFVISPGLYLAVPFVITNFVMARSEFAVSMLLPAAIWTLISFSGVWFGTRKRI